MSQTEIPPVYERQSGHARCHERIAELEAALRAVVDARRLMGWQALPERTLDLAIEKAEKVLNG